MQNLSCREDSIAKLKYFLLINPSKQLFSYLLRSADDHLLLLPLFWRTLYVASCIKIDLNVQLSK